MNVTNPLLLETHHGLTVYNGYEGFMFEGGRGSNEVEPGMVKWLHRVGDYGHLSYAPSEWQPVPFDRRIHVDCEPCEKAGSNGRASSSNRYAVREPGWTHTRVFE